MRPPTNRIGKAMMLLINVVAVGCTFDPAGVRTGRADEDAQRVVLVDAARDGRGSSADAGSSASDGAAADGDAAPAMDAFQLPDRDGDGQPDIDDNCPDVANANQEDLDGDGAGDACDPDRDGDTIHNEDDPRPDQVDQVLYLGQPGSDAGKFETLGDWQPGAPAGSSLCQLKEGDGFFGRAKLDPALLGKTDYLAETQVTVGKVVAGSGWASVGLGVRVTDVAAYSLSAYSCEIDLTDNRLVLAAYSSSSFSTLDATAKNSIPASLSSYRIRFRVTGSQLQCSMQPAGPSITFTDTAFTVGSVAFITYRAVACYTHLLVVTAP